MWLTKTPLFTTNIRIADLIAVDWFDQSAYHGNRLIALYTHASWIWQMYYDAGQHDRFLSEWAWQIQQLWEGSTQNAYIADLSFCRTCQVLTFQLFKLSHTQSYDISFIHILFRVLQRLVLVIMTKISTFMADYIITGDFKLSGSSLAQLSVKMLSQTGQENDFQTYK